MHGVQIVRHGKLVLDAYFYPYGPGMRHDVASVTKSVTSTLIGLAIQKGFVRDAQQPVLSFFPNRSVANSDPGMFEAVGRGGQRINIWPAKDLVLHRRWIRAG